MASVCPIFNEDQGFIGCWALKKHFEPTLGSLSELMSLAEPTYRAYSMNPPRRIDNTSVDVGNGVRFENGVFLMIKEELAPNEELTRTNKKAYVLVSQLGIPCLVRCSRTDSRVKTPPATQPSGGPSASEPQPVTLTPGKKHWWQFWK